MSGAVVWYPMACMFMRATDSFSWQPAVDGTYTFYGFSNSHYCTSSAGIVDRISVLCQSSCVDPSYTAGAPTATPVASPSSSKPLSNV